MYFMLSVNKKVNAIMLEEQGIDYMLKIFEALEIQSYIEHKLESQAEQKAKQQQNMSKFT